MKTTARILFLLTTTLTACTASLPPSLAVMGDVEIGALLIDAELVAQGVPVQGDTVVRLTLTYSKLKRRGWLCVVGDRVRVYPISPSDVARLARAVKEAGVLGTNDTSGLGATDGVGWRIQTRLDRENGMVFYEGQTNPIVEELFAFMEQERER